MLRYLVPMAFACMLMLGSAVFWMDNFESFHPSDSALLAELDDGSSSGVGPAIEPNGLA